MTETLETTAPTESFANKFFAEADAVTGKAPPPPAQVQQTPPPATTPSPAAPAATSAPPADVDAEIESGKRSPRSEDFKRVKEKLRTTEKEAGEVKTKLQTYESELAELRKAPKHNAKLIEEITAERDRYKSIHDQVLLTQLPEFRQQYDAKIGSIIAPLKTMVPEKADAIAEALQLPDGKHKRAILNELMTDLDEYTKGEISVASIEIRKAIAERDNKISESNKTLNSIATERANQAKAAQEEAQKAFDAAVAKVQDKAQGMPIMQLREGDDAKDWNAGVKQRLDMARHIYSGNLSPEERANAAFWASSGETLLKELNAARTELASMKETVARLGGATPSLHPTGGNKTQEVGDPNRPFSSQFSKWEKELGPGR